MPANMHHESTQATDEVPLRGSADADPARAVPEADDIEQSLPVSGASDESDDGDVYREPMPVEADPGDVFEQRLEVPVEDDDYPPT